MFLIRAAFWLSIAVLFIPAEQSDTEQTPVKLVSTGEAIVAAQSVWSDFSAFCDRNPQVCVTGETAMLTFSQKAKNGARMLYNFLDGDDAEFTPDMQLPNAVADVTSSSKPVRTSTIYPTDTQS